MSDRWDLPALGHRRYDEWLSDVGPQPNQPNPRCACCGVRLSIQRAVRHLVCDSPDCEAWFAEAKAAFDSTMVLEYEGIARTLERERDEARAIARRFATAVREWVDTGFVGVDADYALRDFDRHGWGAEAQRLESQRDEARAMARRLRRSIEQLSGSFDDSAVLDDFDALPWAKESA